MMAMKRFAFIFFMVVFVLSNVSLSFAAPCINMGNSASVEMPNCHEMMGQDQSENQGQENNKSTHCDGVCFCKHVAFSSPYLPIDQAVNNVVIAQENISFGFSRSFIITHQKALFRPPIMIS